MHRLHDFQAGHPDLCATRSPHPRGVNRPTDIASPSRAEPKIYPVGRTDLIRGENRRDSRLSRGENRLNY